MTIKSLIQHLLTKQCLAIIILLSNFCINTVHAQDESFDNLALNGMSSFVQLRKEYYIGALYLERLSNDAEIIKDSSTKKRLDIRITVNKWSPRRFAQQWNQLILINNDQQLLEQFTDQISRFIDMPKEGLMQGDRITIDTGPIQGTTIYLNGNKVFNEKNNAFFNILFNTWVGQRPPSTAFKNNILTLSTDQAGTSTLVEYEDTKFTDERKKIIASWFERKLVVVKAPRKKKKNKPAATPNNVAPLAVIPKIIIADSPKPEPTTVSKVPLELSKPTVDLSEPLSVPSDTKAPTIIKEEMGDKKTPLEEAQEQSIPVEVIPVIPAVKVLTEAEKAALNLSEFIKSYRISVLNRTNRNIIYPKKSIQRRQEDVINLIATINRKGQVVEVSEPTPSKYRLLSKTARIALKKAAPYDKFPEDINAETIDINLTINFKL